MSESKSRVPPLLRDILNFDEKLTQSFVLKANQVAPLRTLRIHYKTLEISCHGIPWFAFWIGFTWVFNNPSYIEMQVNMLIGLFIDILLIAISKAYFRRRRPVANVDDPLGQIGPDKFSFPSGHASRAVFVAYFFIILHPLSMVFWSPILAWTICVGLSRILMNRHYVLDVLGGVFLGLFEGCLLGLLWLNDGSAKWVMSFLSDEMTDGGEFHV